MKQEISELKVKNVYRSGDSTTSKTYTDKWIELINRLEKNKSITALQQ